MPVLPLRWKHNLRGNLLLWPEPSPNVAAIMAQDGKPYDEEAFRKAIPKPMTEKTPEDNRSVRNTVEVLDLTGMGARLKGPPEIFSLTSLGKISALHLGIKDGKIWANSSNMLLLGRHFASGLAIVAEYRAIWTLFLNCSGRLSNEELNRAMTALKESGDVGNVSDRINLARESKKPESIGPRFYQDAEYENTEKRTEQRKAMNPWFLLAGAGGILIHVDRTDEYRAFTPWARDLVEEALATSQQPVSIEDANICELINQHSCAPKIL